MGLPVKYCILTLQEIYHLIMPKNVQDAKKWPEGKTKKDKKTKEDRRLKLALWRPFFFFHINCAFHQTVLIFFQENYSLFDIKITLSLNTQIYKEKS